MVVTDRFHCTIENYPSEITVTSSRAKELKRRCSMEYYLMLGSWEGYRCQHRVSSRVHWSWHWWRHCRWPDQLCLFTRCDCTVRKLRRSGCMLCTSCWPWWGSKWWQNLKETLLLFSPNDSLLCWMNKTVYYVYKKGMARFRKRL